MSLFNKNYYASVNDIERTPPRHDVSIVGRDGPGGSGKDVHHTLEYYKVNSGGTRTLGDQPESPMLTGLRRTEPKDPCTFVCDKCPAVLRDIHQPRDLL